MRLTEKDRGTVSTRFCNRGVDGAGAFVGVCFAFKEGQPKIYDHDHNIEQ